MIESLTQFIEEILARDASGPQIIVYRGHADSEYLLIPSIFRNKERYENEHILLRELLASHPEDFSSDSSALEMLVRMQHFSLPTRLLDVTFNPLVALYFACEPVYRRIELKSSATKMRVRADGEVVLLSLPKMRVRYFDSDTVSCIANIARLSHSLKDKIDTRQQIFEFNQTLPVKRLIHFIRQEKNGFEAEIKPKDLDSIILVKPKQNNKRIIAQSGAFFIFGLTQELVDPKFATVNRMTISAKSKKGILRDLDKLGINEKTLFPDIERSAKYITGSFAAPIRTLVK
ncbi:MAG: FRG domain-containing protein [Methylobacterium sp.]|nr:FRG domain-containing protein [Cupriavidus sp.]MCA3513500.1 FRG domain-containing protein [Rhodobacter sp.]MCA3657047.1 FRG domain-containing protein [Methylobacterium sp.]MCA3672585.1 FRG domain-containing protein [Methylobacterium sp.]MCA3676693.1 FRG domain-containing protein [Methylobacterium sp.]